LSLSELLPAVRVGEVPDRAARISGIPLEDDKMLETAEGDVSLPLREIAAPYGAFGPQASNRFALPEGRKANVEWDYPPMRPANLKMSSADRKKIGSRQNRSRLIA
jgi:hypothetical protein